MEGDIKTREDRVGTKIKPVTEVLMFTFGLVILMVLLSELALLTHLWPLI